MAEGKHVTWNEGDDWGGQQTGELMSFVADGNVVFAVVLPFGKRSFKLVKMEDVRVV